MKTLVLSALLFFLFGCSPGANTSYQTRADSTDTSVADGIIKLNADTPPVKAAPDIKTFKGMYTSGNEVSTFRDCANPKHIYWLEDQSKALATAHKKATQFSSYPNESIYLEVKGYLKGKSDIGYAGEYENVLVVTDLLTAVQKSYRTECFGYEYIGIGNEPFWSLDIIPEEKIIAFKNVGVQKTFIFPYKASKTVGNASTYQTENDRGDTLKAVITKEICSDGMSDRKYNYSIRVNINGQSFIGCAIKKGDNI